LQNNAPEQQPDTETISLKGKAFALPTIVSFAFAAFLIIFLLTRFDIDLSATWKEVRTANAGWFLLALFIYYATFPLRGLRWRLLLRNAEVVEKQAKPQPRVRELGLFVFISFFANSVSFFRLGDAFRGYLLTDKWKVSFPRTIGTILAERILDVGVVFFLLLIASIGVLRGETSATAEKVVIAAGAVAVLVGVVLIAMRVYGTKVTRFLPKRTRPSYERFQASTLMSFRNLPPLLLLTVVIWLMEAARLYFVVQSLNFEVGLALVLFAALANSMLTTIPLTPGGLGVVELGLTGLLAIALDRSDAAGVTLLDRSISYFSLVIFGGLAFAIRQAVEMRMRKRTAAMAASPRRS
jgi:uncharacterized protein (TIRG00374 family)